MINVNELRFYLIQLRDGNPTKCVRQAIETLLKIHRNILCDEENVLYRKIKTENLSFSTKVWNISFGRQFMLKCGWLEVPTPDGNIIVFNHDEHLDDIIRVLLEYRFVAPGDNEWKEETKIENLNLSWFREEELRNKAALEREKELEEFQKDKKYREQLNRTVKAQIIDDRHRMEEKFKQAKVSNQQTNSVRIRTRHQLSSTSSTPRRLGGFAPP